MADSRNKMFWGFGAGLIALFVTLVLGQTLFYDILHSFENKTLDWRFSYRDRLSGDHPPIEDIVIVDIDERSLEKYGQFPWPRGYHADLSNYLNGDGVIGVAFDIQFFDTPADRAGHIRFIDAVERSGRIFNAVALYFEDKDRFRYRMDENPFDNNIPESKGFEKMPLIEFDRVDGPPAELADASAALGFVNFVPDADGVTRHLPAALKAAGDTFFPLSLAAVHSLFGSEDDTIFYDENGFILPAPGMKVPVDGSGNLMINYVGPPKSFRYISYYDVKERRLPPGYFEGKFVFVGTSARGLSDLKIVPLSNDFPGVEIHATVMYNILKNQFLRSVSPFILVPVLILLTLLLGVLFYRSGPFIGFLLFSIISLGYFIVIVVMFNKYDTIVELVRPVFTFSLTYLLVIVHQYFGEEKEKKKYRGILQHYVAPTVIKHIINNIDSFSLGGESRELTMLFSDIEGFTGISERLTPQQLVTFLNAYTTIQTETAFEFYGTLDKYIGDALVVIFGAPEVKREINYAECACRAAVKMNENDKIISERFRDLGIGNIRTRVGINTGEVVVGNMGSDVRFSYTVLGDHVNLASRLEGLNKEYRTSIIISEMVRKYTSRKFITRELDMVRVKGRREPVRIYEFIRYAEMDDSTQALLETFSDALRNYRKRDFVTAGKIFNDVLEQKPGDGPSQVFVKRCALLSKNPPSDDWDGVWIMKTK